VACAFVPVVDPAILIPAFLHLGAVLVDAKPAFQLLGPAPLLVRGVPFALLLPQGLQFFLQRIVTWPRRIVRVGHGSLLEHDRAILSSDRIRGRLAKADAGSARRVKKNPAHEGPGE
jgi:hypothetical protein